MRRSSIVWLLFGTMFGCGDGAKQPRQRPPARLDLPAPAHGDLSWRVHPNIARAGAAYMPADGDANQTVDLFNGTLSLRVPVSLDYPVGGTMGTWSLALVYNSNVWEFEGTAQPGTRTAVPAPLSDAGLGWTVAASRLLAPRSSYNRGPRWLYVDTAGRVHPFYQVPHGAPTDATDGVGKYCTVGRAFCNVDAECAALGGTCATDPGGQLVAFTRDGTGLRMRQLSATQRRVEFPDGTTEDFSPATGVWRLTARLDAYGNGYRIDYPSPLFQVITDTTGRVETLSFRADPAGYYAAVLDSVATTAWGSDPVIWQLAYDTVTIPRSCENDNAAFADTVTVPLLRSIAQPDGTTHSFDYDTGDDCTTAGRLKTHTLPTLGGWSYDYELRSYPPMNCAVAPPTFLAGNVGVSQRQSLDAAGDPTGTWTYSASEKGGAPAGKLGVRSCNQLEEIVDLVTPLGALFRHYFSLDGLTGAAGANGVHAGRSEYGLPLARTSADSTGARFISTEVFACASGCPALRTTYSTFEQDYDCNPDALECAATNRRLSGVKEVYWDDPDASGAARFKDAASSDYDGLGHYRTVTTTGTVGSPDALVSRTNFVPAAGTWPSSFRAPSMYDRWLLEVWSSRSQTRGPEAMKTDACFDAAGGQIRARTLLAPASGPGANDVVAETLRDASGNVVSERWYGGDVQTLPLGDLCPFAGVPPQYRLDHTYAAGLRAVSTYVDAAGNPVPAETLHQGVDAPSGLVSSVTDPAGLTTTYDYDYLGHRIGVRPAPGDGAQTRKVHFPATAAAPARVVSTRLPNAGGGPLAIDTLVLDPMGHPAARQQSLPGGAVKEVLMTWDAMGHLVGRSEPGAPGSARPGSTWSGFDPFGRWTRMQRGTEVVIRTYSGVRLFSETRSRAWAYGPPQAPGGTGVSYEAPDTTVQEFDREGGLVALTRSRHGLFPVTITDVTNYTRDLGGHVTQVSVNGVVQRQATVDARGFTSYEVSSTPGGMVQWQWSLSSKLDARGHAHELLESSGNHRANDFDAAERLVAVRDLQQGGRLLKEYVHGGTPNDPARRTGRLWKTIAHNWFTGALPGSDVQIVRELSYAGPGGRISRLTTAALSDVLSGAMRRFDEARTYTELGDLASLSYPACTTCAFPQCTTAVCLAAGPGPLRTLTYAWDQGFLVSMAGTEDAAAQSWIPSLGYSGSGHLVAMLHGDGTIDTWDLDPSGIARIAGASTTYRFGPAQGSGRYEYDSSGSVLAVGGVSAVHPPAAPINVNSYSGVRPDCRPNQGMGLQTYSLSLAQDLCDPYTLVLKDADDRIVYVQDLEPHAALPALWRLYGAEGELLREFAVDNSQQWIQTQDQIRRPGALVATEVRRFDDFGSPLISTKHPAGHDSNQWGFSQ